MYYMINKYNNYIIIFLIFLIFILLFIYNNKDTNIDENNIILLAQFKNETMNLKVWIDHYLWQGIDKIYLIDNDSTDEPLKILQPYIDKNIVHYTFNPKKYNQLENYKELIKKENLQNKTKWLIICDLDEFFYGYPKKLKDTINEFNEYDIIYSNWKMFGSNNLIEHPKDIRKSLLLRQPELNLLTKYIVQIKNINIDNINLHEIYADKLNFIIENNKIKLNHYPIQSLDFFMKVKMKRGDATSSIVDNIRDMNYFYKYDENAKFEDNELKILLELDNL